MLDLFIALIVVAITVLFVLFRKEDGDQNIKSDDHKDIINKKEPLKILARFWSYSEMRSMIAACAVIYFASIMLTSKLEIKMTHEMAHDMNGNIKINHDFAGNMHKPINLQLSDPGYPIKVDVKNK